ncbi:DUF6444 domain-containing protein [Metabacillus litoralis]|jgi:transposase|uniref:DUF6444 domain-containing protein n=1 Tax=Metabacillus litoralis TaxID=152268 RepID=UPI003976EC36
MNCNVIVAAYHQGPEAVINFFVETYTKQELRIQELETSRKRNSTNSHKPPSTDWFQKPVTKSLRSKTGRQTGGQPGHPGHTLRTVETPDSIVIHSTTMCSCCQTSLEKEPVVSQKNR